MNNVKDITPIRAIVTDNGRVHTTHPILKEWYPNSNSHGGTIANGEVVDIVRTFTYDGHDLTIVLYKGNHYMIKMIGLEVIKKTDKLSRLKLIQAHKSSITCSTIKEHIEILLRKNLITNDNDHIEIPNNLIERLKVEGNRDQIEYFTKLGLDLEIDKSYKRGDRFFNSIGSEFMLCQVNARSYCLVNLSNGNRYTEPIEVLELGVVSRNEMLKICGKSTFRSLKGGEIVK